MTTSPTTLTHATAIKTDPQAVWTALTDGRISPAYYYGFSVASDWVVGAPYTYTADGAPVIEGIVTDVDPGRSVAMTFNGRWEPAVAALPESTVAIRLTDPAMPTPGVTILSLVHEGITDPATAADLDAGWTLILSGLKTLLETGAPLVAAPANA